jgi:hypothetical protein
MPRALKADTNPGEKVRKKWRIIDKRRPIVNLRGTPLASWERRQDCRTARADASIKPRECDPTYKPQDKYKFQIKSRKICILSKKQPISYGTSDLTSTHSGSGSGRPLPGEVRARATSRAYQTRHSIENDRTFTPFRL